MKKAILLILGVCILLALVFFKLDIPSFISTISQRLSWSFYAIISFTIVMQLVVRSVRFQLLQKAIIGNSMKNFDAFMLTSSSFFVALATPSKIGDISRGLYAQKNRIEVTAISIIEYLLDLFIVAIVPAFSISLLYEKYAASILLVYGLIAAALFSLYFLKKYFPSKFMAERSVRMKWLFEKLDLIRMVMKKGLSAKLALFYGFLLTCLFYGINFFLFYVIMHKFGNSITPLQTIFAVGTGVFLGTLSFIPMGLGARDASMYGILLSLGTEADLALSAILIYRSLSVPLLLVSSSCYFITIGRKHKPSTVSKA